MTKLFEATFRDGYQFYERYYDTEQKRSICSKINLPYEWYEESPNGLYVSVLDESIKLQKRQGNSKQGRGEYGFLDPAYRNIRDNYWNKNLYNLKPRIWYFDIETRSGTVSTGFPVPQKALEPICMFQIFDSVTETVYMLGVKDWKHKDLYDLPYPVKYINCENELKLIETFLVLFERMDPLILEAWFGAGFDYPYIYNRMKKLGFDVNRLSNHGNVSYKETEYKGRLTFDVKSDGHFFVDLKDVYQKFVLKPRPDHKLDTIAEIELGENKVDHSDYVTFDNFYTGDYIIPDNPTEKQKASLIYKEAIKNGINEEVKELGHSEFCFYSYKDPLLLKLIDDKVNLTNIMIMISEKMGAQISDALGTVKAWSQYIANKALEEHKVMPKATEHEHPKIIGGYVRMPEFGKKKWVLSADATSMYPLLGMVGFNISPETYVPINKLPDELRDIVLSYFNDQNEAKLLNYSEEFWEHTHNLLKKHELSLGINGAIFSQEKIGMIPELVLEIYTSRKKAKSTMFEYEKRKLLIAKIMKEKE